MNYLIQINEEILLEPSMTRFDPKSSVLYGNKGITDNCSLVLTLTKILALIRIASCSCNTVAHKSFQVIGAPGCSDVFVNKLCRISSGLMANLPVESDTITSVKSFSPRSRPHSGQFEFDRK